VPGDHRRLLFASAAKVWEIAVLAAIGGGANAFFFPASAGIVPQTVPMRKLRRCDVVAPVALEATA